MGRPADLGGLLFRQAGSPHPPDDGAAPGQHVHSRSGGKGVRTALLGVRTGDESPNPAVRTGAARPAEVVETMKALEAVGRLSPEIMERIETILDNKPSPEPDFR